MAIGRSRGVPETRSPAKGPDSFISTYTIFETWLPQELAPPYEIDAPLREILDPPLNGQINEIKQPNIMDNTRMGDHLTSAFFKKPRIA